MTVFFDTTPANDAQVIVDTDWWLPNASDPFGRIVLPVQYIISWGTTPAYVAAPSIGHAVDNVDGRTILSVKNGGSSDTYVILRTVQQFGLAPIDDHPVLVPAGSEKLIALILPWLYNQDDRTPHPLRVYVDYSVVTAVTVAAVHGGVGERTGWQ